MRHDPKDRAPSRKRAAVYARESKDYELAIGHQHRQCVQQAEAEGYEVPDDPLFRFGDNERTGANANRADFQRLLSLVRAGQAGFSAIFVKARSRFARFDDTRERFALELELEKRGVIIRYLEEDEPVDWKNVQTSLGDQLMAFLANADTARERHTIRERARVGFRNAVIDGSYPGKTPPWGTERWLKSELTGEWLEPVRSGTGRAKGTRIALRWKPQEWHIIQDVFGLADEGESMSAIANALNEQDVPGPRGTSTWARSTVSMLLNNPIYKGELVWGLTHSPDEEPLDVSEAIPGATHPIRYPDFVQDPPVSEEQWNRVQRRLDGERLAWERRRAVSPDILLSGIVVCAHCGAGYHGNHRPPRKDGTRLTYYRHGQKIAPLSRVTELFSGELEDCPWANRYVRAEVLEHAVVTAVRSLLKTDDFEALVAQAVEDRLGAQREAQVDQGLAKIEERLGEARREQQQAVEYAATSSDRNVADMYHQVVESREAEIQKLEDRVERLRREADTLEGTLSTLPDLDLQSVEGTFDQLSHAEKKAVIGALVHHAELSLEPLDLTVACYTAPKTEDLPQDWRGESEHANITSEEKANPENR